MDTCELEESFIEGIVEDLFMAQYHYFIYRTLGENHKLINELSDETEQMSLKYMQISSSELAILHLAKVFDRNMKSHSLFSLMEECLNIHSDHFPLQLNVDSLPEDLLPYPALRQIELFTGTSLLKSTFQNPKSLMGYFHKVLNKPNIINAIRNVRIARNKGIAHNDKDVKPIPTFWDDYIFVLTLSRLMLAVLSEIFIHMNMGWDINLKPNSVSLNILTESNWIIEKLDKLFGRENINFWWG